MRVDPVASPPMPHLPQSADGFAVLTFPATLFSLSFRLDCVATDDTWQRTGRMSLACQQTQRPSPASDPASHPFVRPSLLVCPAVLVVVLLLSVRLSLPLHPCPTPHPRLLGLVLLSDSSPARYIPESDIHILFALRFSVWGRGRLGRSLQRMWRRSVCFKVPLTRRRRDASHEMSNDPGGKGAAVSTGTR